MKLYHFLKNILFKFDAETSHHIGLKLLQSSWVIHYLRHYNRSLPEVPVEVMGLKFKNPVGLAAGLDKNAECIDAFFAMGFGFVEVGTLTPQPQPGNPKPRLFRLTEHEALINRLGFNNKGIDYAIEKIQQSQSDGILGINLGKNLWTKIDYAIDDYLLGLEKAYPHADYITLNISSPNTPHLRDLYQHHYLENLISKLIAARSALIAKHHKYVPLVIKISCDGDQEEFWQMLDIINGSTIDAVCISNTFVSRHGVENHRLANEQGGLSGAPIQQAVLQNLKDVKSQYAKTKPIISVGGIDSATSALARFTAGASLIQLYTGLIYHGPQLVQKIVQALEKRLLPAG